MATVKLAIVGARTFTDYDKMCQIIDQWIKDNGTPDQIISGGAKGADSLAERYAQDHQIPIIILKPNWRQGRGAGFATNTDIIAEATHVVAFPSPSGKGTQDTIKKAAKKGLSVTVCWVD